MILRKQCDLRFVKVLVVLHLTLTWAIPVRAQQRDAGGTSAPPESGAGPTQQLQLHVNELESEVHELRQQVEEMKAAMASMSAGTTAGTVEHSTVDDQAPSASAQTATFTTEDRSILNYLKGTTINVAVDGYYEWNFNQPVGRVNLLRART